MNKGFFSFCQLLLCQIAIVYLIWLTNFISCYLIKQEVIRHQKQGPMIAEPTPTENFLIEYFITFSTCFFSILRFPNSILWVLSTRSSNKLGTTSKCSYMSLTNLFQNWSNRHLTCLTCMPIEVSPISRPASAFIKFDFNWVFHIPKGCQLTRTSSM